MKEGEHIGFAGLRGGGGAEGGGGGLGPREEQTPLLQADSSSDVNIPWLQGVAFIFLPQSLLPRPQYARHSVFWVWEWAESSQRFPSMS